MTTLIPQRHLPDRGTRQGGENALIAIEVFNGVSAVAGGVALLARPDGAILHMPTALLAGSPFSDYGVPGLALAAVVGSGMLGAALLRWRHRPYAVELEIIAGTALVIFEIVEFNLIGFSPLQVLYGGLGGVVLAVAARRWVAALRLRRPAVW